ncbi:hypothetical protein ABGB12_02075 [Actinocorallia sp. B10E7]|uniref:hypothetical protein n=1 Tax=Actinocorallia sp. B10E7 TaxID=3153558 RepID=UPI00325F5076
MGTLTAPRGTRTARAVPALTSPDRAWSWAKTSTGRPECPPGTHALPAAGTGLPAPGRRPPAPAPEIVFQPDDASPAPEPEGRP